jgi:hypothetical protein
MPAEALGFVLVLQTTESLTAEVAPGHRSLRASGALETGRALGLGRASATGGYDACVEKSTVLRQLCAHWGWFFLFRLDERALVWHEGTTLY